MKQVAIHAPDAATEAEARRLLPALFPEAGTYRVQDPSGRVRLVDFSAAPVLGDDPLGIFKAVFPLDGVYFLKAEPPERQFDRWYFETLLTQAATHFSNVHEVVLQHLLTLVRTHGGDLTDPGALELVERALLDGRVAMRWALAHPVAPAVEARMRAMGLTSDDVLDWPGLAYRLGLIERELERAPFSWDHVIELARAVPLLPGDAEAIAYARAQAGAYLAPVLVRGPAQLVTDALARERALMQQLTADAVRREVGAREFARELYHRLSPEGIQRDFRRVARTELQEARLQGAFAAEARAKGWTPASQVYRTLSARPCNGCLLLYRRPDGMPKVYTVAEVQAGDAQGPNRGPWQEWHVRIGPTHPNCLDSPWITYRPELDAVFQPDAQKWQDAFRRRGLGAERGRVES